MTGTDWTTCTFDGGVVYAFHVPCRRAFIVQQDHDCSPVAAAPLAAPAPPAQKPLMVDGWPRRNRIDLYSPAERVIAEARTFVDHGPADVRLTEAVILLGKAMDKVSDYVDEHGWPTAEGARAMTPEPLCLHCGRAERWHVGTQGYGPGRFCNRAVADARTFLHAPPSGETASCLVPEAPARAAIAEYLVALEALTDCATSCDYADAAARHARALEQLRALAPLPCTEEHAR
jgi:hypothetical protein